MAKAKKKVIPKIRSAEEITAALDEWKAYRESNAVLSAKRMWIDAQINTLLWVLGKRKTMV